MQPICVAAFAAHPDDAELSAGGTLLLMKEQGHRIGIVDLTHGELGTRGTPNIRDQEAAAASRILGLDFRLNLSLPDGQVQNTQAQRLAVIGAIRAVRPDIMLCNAPDDRHPDHGNAAVLQRESAFLAGLQNIETVDAEGNRQTAFRPRLVLHYIQARYLQPDIVVDITDFHEQKMAAIRAFKSQFFDPNASADEPQTYISTPEFMEGVVGKARETGRLIGVSFGEGFITPRTLGVRSLMDLI